MIEKESRRRIKTRLWRGFFMLEKTEKPTYDK